MIQSYKQNPLLQDKYDTIIIGSGMGGLTTGAMLAKEGQKVLILERHYTAGGFTHVFKRKGYEWDVGIHYIGDVQSKNSMISKLFDYIADGNIKWADMGEVYDRIVIGDTHYDLVKGVKNFKKQLTSYFPDEENAINEYVKLVFAATKTSRSFFMSKVIPPFLGKLIGGFIKRPFYKFADRTTYDVISSITSNEALIKVLTGQYGDYGLPPRKSSFYIHALVVRHYFNGGSFPIGGSSQIVKNIVPIIEKAGGTVLINAEVAEVVIERNSAKGVRMNDGNIFYADTIVSSAGIMTTYDKLLPSETVMKHQLKQQLKKVKRSAAHASLYIGFEATPEELQLPKTNYWIYPKDGDHDSNVERYLNDVNEPFPQIYISFPSAKDPDWSNRYPGRSTIDIITFLPYKIFEPWAESRWKKRGKDYEALKEKIAQRLLQELYKQVPQVKGKVAYYELSTPLSTKHFINYKEGEIYGLEHSPGRFRQQFLNARTPIKNFYLTGQDISTAGIGGALISGVLTSTAITGVNMFKKVLGM
jgi:all-trans-retinol 13,14-reductase